MPSSSTSSVSSPPGLLPLWEGATWEHPGAHSCLAPPLHRRRNNGHLLSWLRPAPPTSFLQILALTLYKMVGNWSPAVCVLKAHGHPRAVVKPLLGGMIGTLASSLR